MKYLIRLSLPIVLMVLLLNGGLTPALAADIEGNIFRVSVGYTANGEAGSGFFPSISGDSRYVAYTVDSYYSSIVIYDRQNNTHTNIFNEAGIYPNGLSYESVLSGDGRYVAFISYASNLVANDNNGVADIFRYDRQTRTFTLITRNSSGNQIGANVSMYIDMSSDGRYVVFISDATNLVANDTNGVSDVFVRDVQTGTTTRANVSSAGVQANDGSDFRPSISQNGRYVAFWSVASNLVASDTNSASDVFVRDLQTNTTTRVSEAAGNVQGNGDSYGADISSDGRYVVFDSSATNLVANDTNGFTDVFVKDTQTGTVTAVSVSSGGVLGDYHSGNSQISGDGRYVSFRSSAENLTSATLPFPNAEQFYHRDLQTNTTILVSANSDGDGINNRYTFYYSLSPDGRYVVYDNELDPMVLPSVPDNNNKPDVYLRDTQTSTTTFISLFAGVGSSNRDVDGDSYSPAVSDDGRYVAFLSDATNLVMGDTNGFTDVFVTDKLLGITTRASVGNGNVQANNFSSNVAISGDGRYVAFISFATNLVAGDTNNNYDAFVYDRQTAQTTRVSVTSVGTQATGTSSDVAISGDGRYVAFVSDASNLVTGDTNGLSDVFVRDRVANTTTRVSVGAGAVQANNFSTDVSISGDGRYVVFTSDATNLVGSDTNFVSDIFVRDTIGLTTKRISVNDGGTQANNASRAPMISADGLYIVFESDATNLIVNDTNSSTDIFVYEYFANTIRRVSRSDIGGDTNGASRNPVISGDGVYVAFVSQADNIVAGDTNLTDDLFLVNVFNNDARSFAPIFSTLPQYSDVADLSFSGNFVVFDHNAQMSPSVMEYDNFADVYLFVHELPSRLSAPNLTAPANNFNTTNSSVNFIWSSVAGATAYQIQIATDSNFTNLVHTRTLATNNYTYNLPSTGTYHWRARAINQLHGAWSSSRSFVIQAAVFSAPTLIAPADNALLTNLAMNFSWNSVPTAISYHIEISTNSTFTTITQSDIFAATTYSYTLPSNNIYYWRVRASNGSTWSDWSAVRSFAAGTLYPPTLIAPEHLFDTTDANMTFTWNAVGGATEYQIQMSRFGNFNSPVVDDTVTTTSYSYVFEEGIGVYWRVRAKNATMTGNWSDSRYLNVIPKPAPTGLSPENMALVSSADVTFSWQPVAGVTQYKIEIMQRNQNGFFFVVADQVVNTTSFTFTLPAYDSFSWQVRALGSPNGLWAVSRVNYNAIPDSVGYVHLLTESYQQHVIFKQNMQNFYYINRAINPLEIQERDIYGNVARRIPLSSTVANMGIVDISRDGRYGVFLNYTPLPNEAINLHSYIYDTQTGGLTKILESQYGRAISISDGGRYVALWTLLSLTPDDVEVTGPGIAIGNHIDLYIYDRLTGQFQLASKNAVTNPFGGAAYGVFSPDEQYFAYIYAEGIAPDLFPSYDRGNLYLYHIPTGQVTAVNAPNGQKLDMTGKLSFTANSQNVLLTAYNNLTPNDTNGRGDAFLYNIQTRQFTLLSLGVGGVQGNDVSYADSIADGGRFVTFYSYADNLVSPPLNQYGLSLFARDLQTGDIYRVSEDVNGFPKPLYSSYSNPYYYNHVGTRIFSGGQFIAFLSGGNIFSPLDSGDYHANWLIKVRPPTATPPSPSVTSGSGVTSNPNATFSWNWMLESNRYEIQIATDEAFTNIIHTDNYVHDMAYAYTLPSNGTYYWRVRGVNQLGAGAWSVNLSVLGISANTLMDEQQLFNAMQPHLTNGLTFALFDVTANGILTTLQFGDGAVVTGTIKMVAQNGLLRITVESITGGNTTQQAMMRDTLPSLIITMLDETIPDDYLGIETVSMTTSAVNLGVVLPNP